MDRAFDRRVEAGAQAGQRLGIGVHDLVEHFGHLAGERALQREELVAHRADRKDIAPVIDETAAGNLLRRHVVDGPHEHALMREPGSGHADDPEVQHLDAAFAVHHEVGRLDVAMDDAGAMRVRQPGAEPLHHLEPLGQRNRVAAANQLGQRFTGHVLHGDERPLRRTRRTRRR